MMLKLTLTECKDCKNLSNLLSEIDKKLAYYARNAYNNLTLMVCLQYEPDVISDLLRYKDILTKRMYNCDYATEWCGASFNIYEIISRVKILLNK